MHMKNRMIAVIAMLSLVFTSALSFTGCNQTAATGSQPEVIVRPVAEVDRDYSDMTAVPKPPQETSKNIQWINMDNYGNADLMMMTTLQGNVNRMQPSMYIIHDEMVEGSGLNGSQFWFDQLDQLYIGDEAFQKVEFTDPYAMLVENQEYIKGAIIYHERLTDAAMASRENYPSRYGDMAVLNLTLMMCGQYEAVALNYIQYTTLKEEYGLELEILGDTTKFMEKEEDGSFSTERGSREVWSRVYRYALDTFAPLSCTNAIGHNAGFQAATFDYFVANKIFVYNRIFSQDATEAEQNLELSVMNVSEPNTPVFGCWYLQADEGSMVPMLTSNYKYMIVSYETFNMSWTSGLPYEELKVEEEKLTLDPTKNYIAFTFTEGDNNSYLQFRMPEMFESAARGEYPIGWTIAASCWETNPNIIRYCRMNWAEGDGLAVPEAGVGYVYNTPPKGSQDEFFAISDEYLERNGYGAVRMLQPDLVAALPYAEKMENLDAVFCGYLETGNQNYNSDTSHFLFRNTPIMMNYNGKDAASLIQSDNGGCGFYIMSAYGWQQDPASIKNIMETLGEDFVAVTPNQLADLYRQCYGGEFENVTSASWNGAMTRSEMGFLYKASDYGDYDIFSGGRMADREKYFIYKFDLAEGVQKTVFDVLIEGSYQIEASTDYLNWTVLCRDYDKEKEMVRFDASSVAEAGKALYIRFGDPSEEDGNGLDLYALYLMTDQATADRLDILASQDAAYLISETQTENGDVISELTESGRIGEFTYYLPLQQDIVSGDLMVAAESVSVQISKDGESYSEIAMYQVGSTWYAQLTELSGAIYLRFTAEDAVSAVRFSPTPEPVSQLSFSPVSNFATKAYFLSLDDNTLTEEGYASNRAVKDDAVMVYRFVTAAAVTEARLHLNASGIYKLSVSNDGQNYTSLYEGKAGENTPNPNTIDITDFAAGGKTVYVQFGASRQIAGKSAKLVKLRMLTNLITDPMLQKLEKEREPNAVVLSGSDAERSLLDNSRSASHFLYQDVARCMHPNADAAIVYKYDTNSDAFFRMLGLEKTEITKLRVTYNIGNAYKISVSGDGKTWTEVMDTNDDSLQSASNLKDVEVVLTDAMIDGVVYVKISRSDTYVPGKTHDGLIWNTKFFIN